MGGSVHKTMNNLAQQMSPFAKSMIELTTGRDLFWDRPLEESTTPADRIYKSLTGSQTGLSPTVKVAINALPVVNIPLSIGGALADDRIPLKRRLLKAGVNQTLGMKITDVDEKAIVEEQRQKVAGTLKGKSRTFSKAFVPADVVPELSPQEYQLYLLDKDYLEKKAKRLRDQERLKKAQTKR